MRYDAKGGVRDLPSPPSAPLPRTLWGIERRVGSEAGTPRVIETLEDTPFYARSIISTRLGGMDVTAMHESLSLARFAAPWVQAMLPFRMPRRFGR